MVSLVKLRLYGQPSFESTPIFCCLKEETKNALRSLPCVYKRAVAALRFRQQISGPHSVSDEDREIMQVAYLRTSLMEFVAMEEVLPFDLQERGLSEKPLKMEATENAMLILLRELRHLQLHVVTTTFSKEVRSAMYIGQEKTLKIEIVPLTDLLEIKQLKNAKRYDPVELDAAINWLNEAQLNWGIGDVLQRGVQVYADILVNKYNLHTP